MKLALPRLPQFLRRRGGDAPASRAPTAPRSGSLTRRMIVVSAIWIIMLLGVGDAPKIMIAFMLGVIAVIVNTLNGLDRVPQVLVKTADQRGRKAICEIMVVTRAIGKLIMTDQTHQIPTQLQMGKDQGMQMLDQALLANVQAKEIDPDDAYVYANDKKVFARFVTDTSVLPKLDLAPG